MALINCPECGKEISDKADSCPNCGCPVKVNNTSENEEYLCCPKCHSKELHAEKKGYSGGKALAGVVLAGGIGLLAGTIGSKDIQIICLKCGKRFKAGEAYIQKKKTNNSVNVEKPKRDLSEDELCMLKDILEEEGRIKAITYCNERTNKGLADSKKIVDDYIQRKNINVFEKPASKTGCAGVILIMIFIIVSLVSLI